MFYMWQHPMSLCGSSVYVALESHGIGLMCAGLLTWPVEQFDRIGSAPLRL
jgi:hypothetical protein